MPIERRTILRRLDTLIERGQVLRIGRGRGVLYRLVSEKTRDRTSDIHGSKISLSTESIHIQLSVNSPINARSSIGYNTLFLERYQPNITHYLSENEQNYLEKLGAQQDGKLPAGTFARKILDQIFICAL